MTRNKIADLNNHLFAELERLGDDELTGEQLDTEIHRAQAISKVASQLIASGNLTIRAAEFQDQQLDANSNLPPLLSGVS